MIALTCAAALCAQTRIGGIIDKSTRWTPEGSPYTIISDILITSQAKLTIAPGTRIFVDKPVKYDDAIPQIDRTDSTTVAIKIRGMLSCVGRADKRIVFSPVKQSSAGNSWYGIVFDGSADDLTEIAYADIAGACNGVRARNSSPLVRNTIIEFNNVGVYCAEKGNVRLYNCVIAHNLTCGVRIVAANPVIYNCIVVDNRNNGVWCDGVTKATFAYNCVFGNGDGNFMECDPGLGVVREPAKEKNAKSLRVGTDLSGNLVTDPIFAGSPAESLAVERDLTLKTDKSRVHDTTLARALHDTLTDSSAARARFQKYPRYTLSEYSPCVNAGNPDKEFLDDNGSRNDMGIFGGPDYVQESK
jgi:hypothetical protein